MIVTTLTHTTVTLTDKFSLVTNYRIKSLDLDHLKNCSLLKLDHRVAIDDKEVGACERILAHAALLPRPENPYVISLPKVKPQQPLFQFSLSPLRF